VLKVIEDLKVQVLVLQDSGAHKDIQDHKVVKVQAVQKDTEHTQVLKGIEALKVQALVLKDIEVHKVHRVNKDIMEVKDTKVIGDLKVDKVVKV